MLAWKDIITILSFVASVAGLGWWLARQFGEMRETLARIEEREKQTALQLDAVKAELRKVEDHARDELILLRERVLRIETLQ